MLKDELLKRLSDRYNVARFASFAPDLSPRFGNPKRMRLQRAVEWLCEKGPVNIRAFSEDGRKGLPLAMDLDAASALAEAGRLCGQGLYIIMNEAIPLSGRMASGVLQGGFVEAAPNDTPRCVENGSCSCLPAAWMNGMLSCWLSAGIRLPANGKRRLEFSAYAHPVGERGENLVFWEDSGGFRMKLRISENDPFAAHFGDKAWGLLLAHAAGFPVPRTTVFRKGTSFPLMGFGSDTGSDLCWTRTCPERPAPGKYFTARGWHDPQALFGESGDIASVIVQQEVPAKWSGAAMLASRGPGRFRGYRIEGVEGFGDAFMSGAARPVKIPGNVERDVQHLLIGLGNALKSDIHMEWAHDGKRAWVLQLHPKAIRHMDACVVVPGKPEKWIDWHVDEGLGRLREIAAAKEGGVRLLGGCGYSSHAADIMRQAEIPAVIVNF